MIKIPIIRNYFGEIIEGRLTSKCFVGLWLLLAVIFVGFGIFVGLSIGIAEHIVGGDLKTAQQLLREKLAIPTVLILAIFFLAFAFANLNIIAKRARDTGLPGWITAIVVAGLAGSVSQFTDTAVTSGGIGVILIILLALIPTDQFRTKT